MSTLSEKKPATDVQPDEEKTSIVTRPDDTVIIQTISDLAHLAPQGVNANEWAISQFMSTICKKGQKMQLASMLTASHRMAMNCMASAIDPEQTFEGRDLNLKHAVRLMNAYANLSHARDKHLGKGQQKITVEHQHVQVESGGQAIIGDVRHGGGGGEESK